MPRVIFVPPAVFHLTDLLLTPLRSTPPRMKITRGILCAGRFGGGTDRRLSRVGGSALSGRALLCALVIGGACSPPPPEIVEPVPDIEERVEVAESSTQLEAPTRIVFEWAAREVGGGRVSGTGVARAEPPYRARLDLFLDNNEAVARAALVDDEVRLPPGVRDDLLPPLHFLWGTLGVFRPGVDQTLLGGERVDGLLRIRYRLGDDSELHYTLNRSRVVRLERVRRGSVVERMEIEYTAEERIPGDVVYRDLATGRELTLTRTSLEHVESFPPDIWGD